MRSYSLPAYGVLAAGLLVIAACSESPSITSPQQSSLVPVASAQLDRDPAGGTRGAVFTATNAPTGNAVVAFGRAGDGSLTYAATFNTGGNGIGGTTDPLGSQYSMVLDRDQRLLFVVNAGSNSISTFRVNGATLSLVGTTSSGGMLPTSLAIAHHTLYALNAASSTIMGFDIKPDGRLASNTAASAALSPTASGGAAIRASRDGKVLVVTEKGSRTIDVFPIGHHGVLGTPVLSPSVGVSPFGFDFVGRHDIAVSEAGSAAASLYDVERSSSLKVQSASVSTNGQAAPCWLIATTNGRFAYTANAGSGTISGYTIGAHDVMTLLVPNGVSGSTGAGSTPLDLDLSAGDRYLYVLESGAGRIGAFALGPNGSLAPLPGVGGITPQGGFQGLAAY